MRAGVWIVNVSAAVWGVVGFDALRFAWVWWAVPVLVSTALIVVGLRGVGRRAARTAEAARWRVRATLIWTGIEAVLMVVAVNVLVRFGYPGLVVPAIVLIVGLHLVPLAFALDREGRAAMVVTGVAMSLVSLVSATLPLPYPAIVTAFGAALLLWGAGLRWV